MKIWRPGTVLLIDNPNVVLLVALALESLFGSRAGGN